MEPWGLSLVNPNETPENTRTNPLLRYLISVALGGSFCSLSFDRRISAARSREQRSCLVPRRHPHGYRSARRLFQKASLQLPVVRGEWQGWRGGQPTPGGAETQVAPRSTIGNNKQHSKALGGEQQDRVSLRGEEPVRVVAALALGQGLSVQTESKV